MSCSPSIFGYCLLNKACAALITLSVTSIPIDKPSWSDICRPSPLIHQLYVGSGSLFAIAIGDSDTSRGNIIINFAIVSNHYSCMYIYKSTLDLSIYLHVYVLEIFTSRFLLS